MQEDSFTEAEHSALMRDSKIFQLLEDIADRLTGIEYRLSQIERELELIRRGAR